MGIKKLIAIFLLIAVLLMPVSVFAGMSFPDPPSDVWEYWVIVEQIRNPGYFDLVCSYNPIMMQSYGSGILLNGTFRVYSLDKVNGRWANAQEFTQPTYGLSAMHASNHDIAYDDGSGFFFLRDRGTLLFPEAMKADFGIILRTISAGLIPLVGLLILAISFRKGWVFLKHQLMH